MMKISIILLAFLISLSSCEIFLKAKPIPKDKESFIGFWKSNTGFQIEIKPTGTANLYQFGNSLDSNYNKLNIKVASSTIKDMIVLFTNKNTLEVIDPFNYAKIYSIDKSPYKDGDTTRLVLNGVEFIKQ